MPTSSSSSVTTPAEPVTQVDLASALGDAAVLTDFDGTLSAIVDDPAAAVPVPGAAEVLSDLAGVAPVVGVVSGRPVEVLARHLTDPALRLAGLYGLERRVGGEVVDLPDAATWAAAVAAAVADLRARLPAGAVVESKRLSLTVHYRQAPQAAAEVVRVAREVAAAHGLVDRSARMSVEVHPRDTPDKGTVVEELATGRAAACFLGDDVGDVPAFDALDRLAARGLTTVRVAVRSEEVAAGLVDRADVVVEGPAGAVAWLRSLLPPT